MGLAWYGVSIKVGDDFPGICILCCAVLLNHLSTVMGCSWGGGISFPSDYSVCDEKLVPPQLLRTSPGA
jgi:hypothetical protein